MKVLNFLFGIYLVISFTLIFDPILYWIQPDIEYYLEEYKDIVDNVKYINFALCFILALILFYLNGYNDGKKENILKDNNMDKR